MIGFNLLRSFVLIFLRIFSIAFNKNIFHSKYYTEWRRVRIKKLLSIYNVKNKKILELGAATGAIGKILSKYGANVTISDARAFLLEKIKSKNLTKIIINNDEDNWSKVFKNNERFDLIVHWGLLYHLYNWKEDLKECLKLADYICLETVIIKVTEQEKKTRGGGNSGQVVFEYGQDQSANFIAKIPSQESIEKYLKSQGCTFKRFDDKDLDVYLGYKDYYFPKFIVRFGNFFSKRKALIKNNKVCSANYSWDTNPPINSRRFWLIKSNNIKK